MPLKILSLKTFKQRRAIGRYLNISSAAVFFEFDRRTVACSIARWGLEPVYVFQGIKFYEEFDICDCLPDRPLSARDRASLASLARRSK